MRRWFPFALAALVVLLDQVTKAWVVAEVPFGARVASWGGIAHLTHTRNTGAAFGLLRDRTLDVGGFEVGGVQLLGAISLIVAIGLAVWLFRARKLGIGTRFALGAIMGGAVGNGIDRWRLGYVTDFAHLQAGWFDFPVFNVADVGISVGAGLLLLSTLALGRLAAATSTAPTALQEPPGVQEPPGATEPPAPAGPAGDQQSSEASAPTEASAPAPADVVADAPAEAPTAERPLNAAPAGNASDR